MFKILCMLYLLKFYKNLKQKINFLNVKTLYFQKWKVKFIKILGLKIACLNHSYLMNKIKFKQNSGIILFYW